jgi:hypothetical protein
MLTRIEDLQQSPELAIVSLLKTKGRDRDGMVASLEKYPSGTSH